MHFRIKSLRTSYHYHVYLLLTTVLLATNLLSFWRAESLLRAAPAEGTDAVLQAPRVVEALRCLHVERRIYLCPLADAPCRGAVP
jgi:hypothetical protein